jgi:hypothetical protein
MGRFVYEDVRVDFDDRTLAHLQVVILAKLRRRESFAFSWRDDVSVGGGHTTVWLHPGCKLVFKFSGSKQPELSRDWVEALSVSANSPGGLMLIPERSIAAARPADRVAAGAHEDGRADELGAP